MVVVVVVGVEGRGQQNAMAADGKDLPWQAQGLGGGSHPATTAPAGGLAATEVAAIVQTHIFESSNLFERREAELTVCSSRPRSLTAPSPYPRPSTLRGPPVAHLSNTPRHANQCWPPHPLEGTVAPQAHRFSQRAS